MGKALDWAGPRAMVSIVGLALAMTCMFMSMADSAVALCVCFFFLRFFGTLAVCARACVLVAVADK